eukprot:5957427-Pyramimonas_sp.AAC.1
MPTPQSKHEEEPQAQRGEDEAAGREGGPIGLLEGQGVLRTHVEATRPADAVVPPRSALVEPLGGALVARLLELEFGHEVQEVHVDVAVPRQVLERCSPHLNASLTRAALHELDLEQLVLRRLGEGRYALAAAAHEDPAAA